MTANQRRPGFRLPWASEADAEDDAAPAKPDGGSAATPASAATGSPAVPGSPAAEQTTTTTTPASAEAPTDEVRAAQTAAHVADTTSGAGTPAIGSTAAGDAGTSDEFMRGLVAAMRTVADEARQQGLSQLRARAEEEVRRLEADLDRRREQLRQRAETDVAGVGEWARAEAERIKSEAEQRVAARRSQLEQQLAGEAARTESETKALRERVAEYERELAAFHAQLAEINDPAAFAAAAKRMPPPPKLGDDAAMAAAPTPTPAPAPTNPDGRAPAQQAPVEPAAVPSNGVAASAAEVHPAEEEVLAARLAELDASLPENDAAPGVASEPVTTEIIVKGLSSFGAITGFRQSLAGVDGVDGVALSLGQTGEFVFRATHRAGFDVRAAITKLEGDEARVEERREGGYKVTLDRAR